MKSGSSATVEPARVTFNGTVCCWSEATPTVRVHISLRLPIGRHLQRPQRRALGGQFPALIACSPLQGLFAQQPQPHPVGLLRHLPALLLQQLQ